MVNANTDMSSAQLDLVEALIAERTAELRDAHAESERVLDAIASLLVGVDASGIVNRWNGSATELFGITADESMGKKFVDLDIVWEDSDTIRDLFEMDDSGFASRVETAFIDASGKSRILGWSAYPVGAPGACKGTLLLGADLTEKKVFEHQLHQAQKLEAVGQLAAGVAHEINTPMQYLGDNTAYLHNQLKKLAPLLLHYEEVLELAEQSGECVGLISDLKARLKKLKVKSFLPQVEEAISDSIDGVKHVSRIVRAMKEFSHPGQDERACLDINNALESAAVVSTNEWKYVAEVVFDLDPSLPLVSAFPGEMNQVFLNILVNAAHAIADANPGGSLGKGTITISTACSETHVSVAISDTGTGIPNEIKRRIFDPFFTTKQVGKGTGQGLSIAYSVVVQKHGGSIACDSAPGEGTTFLIQLPIEDFSETRDDETAPAMCQA